MPSRTDSSEDQPMQDAPAENANEGAEATTPASAFDDSAYENGRLRSLQGATPTAASFEFLKEDHTLGNALRYIIMKNPDVEFCAYTIPHPSEARMNLRIQTYDEVNVHDVLSKGLDDLMDLCDVVIEKFTEAREEFAHKTQ